MQQQRAILLLDQGGHSTRAMLFSHTGEKLLESSAPVSTYSTGLHHHEMQVDEVLASLNGVISDIAVKACTLNLCSIEKAGIVVQRSSFLVCRKDTLEPITPIISWMDSRHHIWLDQQRDQFKMLQSITGLYPNAHYALSKIRWLLQHDERVHDEVQRNNVVFVPLAAFLVQQLCQNPQFFVDPVIASRTLMMDLNQQCWSAQLTDLAGINPCDLPTIVGSDYHFGTINCGMFSVPLSLSGGDQSFVAFSAGLQHANEYAFINIGSGAFIQTLCAELPTATQLLKSPLFIGQHEQFFVLEGTVNAAASALDNLFLNVGAKSYTEIEEALSLNINIPLYQNTHAGSGSPYWLASNAPCFSFEAEESAQIVAVLESIIFALVANWRLMQPYSSAKRFAVSGGLSLSDRFCQKLADCSGMQLVRVDDHEASARGAAYFMLKIKTDSLLTKRIFIPIENAPLLKRYQQFELMMDQLCQTTVGYQ